MISRYEHSQDCMADCFCDMRHSENGDYVEYDDYLELKTKYENLLTRLRCSDLPAPPGGWE